MEHERVGFCLPALRCAGIPVLLADLRFVCITECLQCALRGKLHESMPMYYQWFQPGSFTDSMD